MTINATFKKITRRNEKSGKSVFFVSLNENKDILCSGVIQNYPKYTPLALTGTYETDKSDLIFNVEKVKAAGYSYETTAKFLYSKEFPDVGMAIAKSIIDSTDINIFSYIYKQDNLSDIINIIPAPLDVLQRVFRKIRGITVFEELIEYLSEYGGEYCHAAHIFDHFGIDAMSALLNNPYILLYAGAALEVCEHIAHIIGIEHCDSRRMKALVEHAMINVEKNGNTMISFHELCKYIRNLDKKSGFYTTSPLFIAEALLSDSYYLFGADNDIFVYTTQSYKAERLIAENVQRINQSAWDYRKDGIPVKKVEADCAVRYSTDQKNAFRLMEKSGIKIVTGGPGTGKTTLLKGILYKYHMDYPNASVALCAPTGCAARRMQECTGESACTIHKLLKVRPFEDILDSSSEKLDADLVVVDESSMIDTVIMARLLMTIKNGAMVVFLGDKDQLPSVSAGNVFGDILSSGIVETYYLNSVFRQDARSLIVANSNMLINGSCNLKTGESFHIHYLEKEDDIINKTMEIVKKCKKSGISNYKIYTPSKNKKFKSGTIQINKLVEDIVRPKDSETITYGAYTFSVGDTVLFNRNNYEKGYFNGQEGIIRDIQKHTGMIHMTIEADEDRIYLTGQELQDIELAYAITAHKSQSGECDNAIILVPKEPHSLLKKQLLYVEITRARKCVIMLCEKDALKEAAGYKGQIVRRTGLKRMLEDNS